MTSRYAHILRKHSRPLEPIPADREPVLVELEGIRAVLFDLYGTLFISGSGEVGTSGEARCDMALAQAMAAVGIRPLEPLDQGVEYLFETIKTAHAELRKSGIDYPEVDLIEVWREVLGELSYRGVVELEVHQNVDLARMAVEYEARANPCWPMPGLTDCLSALRQKRIVLGIISNAQFFTPELFPALLGQEAEAWGFEPDLQLYSYRYWRAKPGLDLFQKAAEVLSRRRIEPGRVLYVGNDMLNDVLPAGKVGFRTALFAGDARSLRLRDDDPRLEKLSPQLILTALRQLEGCIIA